MKIIPSDADDVGRSGKKSFRKSYRYMGPHAVSPSHNDMAAGTDTIVESSVMSCVTFGGSLSRIAGMVQEYASAMNRTRETTGYL
jgi:hypothetical protein